MDAKQEKKKKKIMNTTTIGMSQSDLIQKNGEAASQMMQAHKGVRFDSAGNDLGHKGRSLKQISNYKTNERYESQNIKQQSGFSAELIKEARDNKEAIKSGNSNRIRTTDGIGQSNHQQYDHMTVDSNGNVIEGSGSQMKFLGIDSKGRVTVVDKIVNDSKWKKYDGYIDIPEDQYDKAIKYAENKASELRKQAQNLKNKGEFNKAKEVENKANKYEDSKKKIRKSNVKESEAIKARRNPGKFVRKEVLNDSHNAGLESAKGSVIFVGSMSLVQNIYSILAEDKDIDEATMDVVKDTSKAGAIGYGIGASGTAMKSIMHTSKNSFTRRLGTTNFPTMIATGTVAISKSMKKYANGDIDEVELLEELGEKGTGMIAAGFGTVVGAAAGSVILPGVGTAVGSFVGNMVACALSGMIYKGSLEALKGAKISIERRKVIEELSEISIREMKAYQKVLIEYADSEFQRREDVFKTLLKGIYQCILNNDIDGFIDNINGIGKEFGMDLGFKTFEEFKQSMDNDDFVLIL